MCDTSWAAYVVALFPVMCTSLLNACSINGVEISPLNSKRSLRLGAKDRYKVRINMWNVGTLIDRNR